MNQGGAKSTGIASFIPASFLKRLFVQSEVELEKFGEVSRNLHLAVRLRCHVWNKIMPNRVLFNTCLGKSKINAQLGLPSKLTPK